MAGVGREAVMRSGEGGGGGPTDVGVWGRVRKVNKIARLKGQDWELISLETSWAPRGKP